MRNAENERAIRQEIKLAANRHRVPADLDAQTTANQAMLAHAMNARTDCWTALSHPALGYRERESLAHRVEKLTQELDTLWHERRRLLMLGRIRSNTHEANLDGQGRLRAA